MRADEEMPPSGAACAVPTYSSFDTSALSLGDDLLVEAGDAGGDRRPAVAAAGVGGGSLSAPAPLARVRRGLDQRRRQCPLVVGGDEPAALPVPHDRRRPVGGAGDR